VGGHPPRPLHGHPGNLGGIGHRERPSSSRWVRPVTRSQPVTQAKVMVVSPKERSKVAGLRNDTGPCHAPPATSHAAPWATPATISTPPVR